MNLKKNEFRTLRQGGRMLKEYMDDFCSLSRYALEDIDTDTKRKDKFLSGLKGELRIPLSMAYAPSYQALLDQAVTLENNIRKEVNRKRKFNGGKNHTEPFHKSTTPLRVVGMETLTGTDATSQREMVATSMAIGTMEDSRETTPMAITIMVTTMGETDITVSTQMPRRISPMPHASSVRRLGTTPQAAQRTRQMTQPSPIHSRRDRSTTSMLRR
jgi:hypothetical protein